jgi:hypothetical protein
MITAVSIPFGHRKGFIFSTKSKLRLLVKYAL